MLETYNAVSTEYGYRKYSGTNQSSLVPGDNVRVVLSVVGRLAVTHKTFARGEKSIAIIQRAYEDRCPNEE